MSKKCEVASEKSFEETGKGYLNGTIKKKTHANRKYKQRKQQ